MRAGSDVAEGILILPRLRHWGARRKTSSGRGSRVKHFRRVSQGFVVVCRQTAILEDAGEALEGSHFMGVYYSETC